VSVSSFLSSAILLLAALLINAALHAASNESCKAPSWSQIQNKTWRAGSKIRIICIGEGPTPTIAQVESKTACDSSAAGEFSSEVKIRDLVVLHDHDVVMDQEIASTSCVLDLFCFDLKSVTCAQNGVYIAYRQCTYDLSKARLGRPDECLELKGRGKDQSQDSNLATIKKRTSYPAETSFDADGYVLTISSTPQCADLVVVAGSSSRRIACTSNPMRLPIKPGDEAVLVRAKGYLPKTIDLKKYNDDGQVMVFLDQSN
jgi:hypothetical protein